MSRPPQFKFELYVAGDTENSTRAVANLTEFCRAHLANNHEIEIVDVFREPKRALANSVFMTPTLIKLTPSPVRRMVGTLSETSTMRHTLRPEIAAA